MYSVCKTFSDVFLDSFSTTLEVACYIHKDNNNKKIFIKTSKLIQQQFHCMMLTFFCFHIILVLSVEV